MVPTLLAGLGLSASAGLNAYLPLLILALADRFTGVVGLGQPYNLLSSNAGIIVLLLVLPAELVPDKIARLDHLNDLVHSAIRPVAAAIVFMAVASQNDHLQPVAGMLLGLVTGAGVHWLKSSVRPRISARTRGVGNPFISMLEDMLAIVTSTLAVFLPMSMLVMLPISAWLLLRSYQRLSTGKSRFVSFLSGQSPPPT